MVDSETPAGARRRLRVALRRQREEAGLTQSQVAEALDWSLSKVQRIEAGEVSVSSSDLKASLALYGITDMEQINKLVAVARATRPRRSGWWDEPRYRAHMSPAFRDLLQFERQASSIRVYNPSLFPGLLQTPEYARVIFDFWRNELPDDACDIRLELRMRRRTDFLERGFTTNYLLILDESVLYREVGGPKVMHGQLRETLRYMREDRIRVRIVPYARAAPLAQLNHFSILTFEHDDDAILYQEAQLLDFLEQSRAKVRVYRDRFERLWNVALNEEATARLMEATAATLLSALDRNAHQVDG